MNQKSNWPLISDTNGTVYTYTSDGKLASRIWARGITTSYSYTNSGEMIGIGYSDSTPDVTFAYDRLGRQKEIVDGQGAHTFAYNPQTLALTNETIVAAYTNILTRTQDSLGRNTGFTLGDNYSVGYSFDDVGRFSSVTSQVSGSSLQSFVYSYLPNSDLIVGWSNGLISVVKSYEPNRNLLLSVDNKTNGATLSKFEYVNDAIGRRTKRVDTSSVTNDFGYNSRSELTSAIMGANDYAYWYDNIGNRTESTELAEIRKYLANQLNQYTVISNSVTITPKHDLDGNMTNYGVFAYSWDAENRLVGVSSNGSTIANYKYDYMSRRVEKVVGSVTNRFIYDGWAMIQEISGTPALPNSVTNYFVYGLDLSGSLQGAGTIGGILYGNFSGTNAFYFGDGNGNVTELVSANGTTLAHYEYDPYGNTVTKTGVLADINPYRFSSKYWDAESGLYYYGYRYYEPRMGRWPSRDPIGESGGLDLYTFVENSVPNKIDFLGLMKVCCDAVRGPWYERMFRHCHIADSCGTMEAFDIWTDDSADRKMDNGKTCNCVTKDDIQACIQRHPYSAAPRGPQEHWWDYYGNNCQVSVVLTLGNCCLKSTWRPNWYAPPRGECTHYEVIVVGESAITVCTEWEVPDWRGENPPQETDPRIPPVEPPPNRPPAPNRN